MSEFEPPPPEDPRTWSQPPPPAWPPAPDPGHAVYGQPPPPGVPYAAYGAPAPYGAPYANPFDNRATTVLVLGILGLVFCQICAPVAWAMGNSLRADALAAGWTEPSTAKAGRICGIVGTALIAVFILFFVGVVILGSALGNASTPQ